MSRATTATIHLAALRHNLGRVRELAPTSRVMAVVKADGYGHGLERVARALATADAFGVAALSDAERLRAAGFSQRVVLLPGFDEVSDLAELRRLDVDTVVHHESQLAMLEADRGRRTLRVWLKFDTGMHRFGFPAALAEQLHARLKAAPCVADASGRPRGAASLLNPVAILGWPEAHRDWVCAGGALYGLSVVEGKTGADFGLQAAMTLSTRLISINRVAKGEKVGYGATWECPEDMDVGVAAIGYGDGFPRSAPAGTPVLVNGLPVPLIGRVSMDFISLDLRRMPQARVGDPVVLWGAQLPVERLAAATNTISCELTCSIPRRVRFVEA